MYVDMRKNLSHYAHVLLDQLSFHYYVVIQTERVHVYI